MRWSQAFVHTLRQDPADAEVVSHRLMMRAGLISKVAAGIYNYLPLGWRSIAKLMDIVREVQEAFGGVSDDAMDLIAKQVRTHRVEVESVVSFYAFLSKEQQGKVVISLCDDIIDRMFGFERIRIGKDGEGNWGGSG